MSVRKLIEGKGSFVSVVPSHMGVDDTINQLEADDVSAIVVSDDGKNILGIISGVDIVRGLKSFGRDVGDRRVNEIMTRKVITCDIAEPLSIPITRNSELCGIINILDVIKFRLAEIQQEAEALKNYIAGRI
jgi:predicted transcriptional regulator